MSDENKVDMYVWLYTSYACEEKRVFQITGKKKKAKVEVQYVVMAINDFQLHLMPLVKEVLFPGNTENQKQFKEEVKKILEKNGENHKVIFAVFRTSINHQKFIQVSGDIVMEDLSVVDHTVLLYHCNFAFDWFINEFQPRRRDYN